MEEKDWTVVHAGSDRLDLECEFERKTIRRPKHMTKPEFVQQMPSAGQTTTDGAIDYIIKKR
jgi:hypothetical protein